jgi:hypothetical protein
VGGVRGRGRGEGGEARPWNEGSESGTKSNSKRLDGAMQQVIVYVLKLIKHYSYLYEKSFIQQLLFINIKRCKKYCNTVSPFIFLLFSSRTYY